MTDLAKPGRKYAGKLKVGGGPVPLKNWKGKDKGDGPLTLSPKGSDLRGEVKK